MVPRTVLTRYGLILVNAVRPVNTVQSRTTMNNAGPMKNIINSAYSTTRRPFNKITAANDSNFTKKVNTVKGTRVNTARLKVVISAAKGNKGNAVKASACWLTDESHVLLKVPRKDNMYIVDLKNVVPQGGLTCLFAKATPDESNLWHRRLGHVNFKTMNKLKTCISLYETIWCPVTILNTIDHLGKFHGKADEGFFVGYSTKAKHSEYSNTLTKSMNHKPVVAGSQSNGNAGTKACNDADSKSSPDAGFKPSGEEEKKDAEDLGNEYSDVLSTEEPRVDQEKDDNKLTPVFQNQALKLPDDPNMPELEDIVYSDDDEDVGAEADMNNLDTFMPVSPIPTTRIHKDHPVEQIIGDMHSAPQTRRMTKILEEHGLFSSVQQRIHHKDFQNCLFTCFLSRKELKKIIHALKDPRWIKAMQEELLQFKLQKGLDSGGFTKIEAIRLFLAYASFKDFVVYQMDVKSAFLYGKIKEEVYVCQPPGFEDPDFP
ncbi:putative ribonuclease H-like domain-containing protein [Tanacetum coccineum]